MSGTVQPAQTGAQTVSSGAAGVFPTTFGYYPAEGSRCISAIYTWPAGGLGYQEDFSQLEARGVETTIQSAYVDNSACGQAVTFLVQGTGQNITVDAYTQQIIPLFFTGAPFLQLSVAATDTGATRVFYLNVPGASSSSWGASFSGGSPVPAYPQGSVTAGEVGPLMQATVITSNTPVTGYSNATTDPLVMDGFGSLKILPYGTNGRAAVQNFTNAVGNSAQMLIAAAYNISPAGVAASAGGAMQIDSRGALKVINESDAQTYSAATAIVLAVAATDVFAIYGSATKTIRVHQIVVSLDSTAGTQDIKVSIIKRSAINTGGASGAVAAVPHSSANAAATASVLAWTANPTGLGAAVGAVEQFVAGAPPNSGNVSWIGNYGPAVGDQSLILVSANEGIAVNLEGAALVAGEAIRCKVKWTEI